MNSSNSSNPTTLRSKLGQIVRDERRYRQWRALARWWLIASVAGIAVLAIVWVTDWRSPALWWVVAGFALAGAGMSWWRERGEHDHRWVVARIERENPQLKALLMTASEQEPDAATGTLTYLQERVILEAIDQERRSPWVQRMIE
ncbi:MAG TPA: hypothetical protein VMS21_15260, partial [Methylomirabilota bacterium]|nr:hypothetical protein [Methylomirabilota bacterium]